jgi:hypothetical protein
MPPQDQKITELDAATTLADTDLLVVVVNPNTAPTDKKITVSDLRTAIGTRGHIIQDVGVTLTQRAKLNFVGNGVAVADDVDNDATVVTVSGVSAVVSAESKINALRMFV